MYQKTLDLYYNKVEQALPNFLPSADLPQNEVIHAMKYSLCGGGKRVRAVLLLAFYELFSKESNITHALPFAAAIEMIHAYSLIHDDLPCMDDDDLRRGKPSCHIEYGESTALLAGDGLLTLAFEAISRPENLEHFSAEQIVNAVHTYAFAAGTEGMIGGQILDLENEEKKASEDELKQADKLKTGALFKAAITVGGILGNATKEQLTAIGEFADKIGLVFQIADDILDATSTQEKLGKPIGSDKENEKTTYVTIYGVDKAGQIADGLTSDAVEILNSLNLDTSFIEKYTKELTKRDY